MAVIEQAVEDACTFAVRVQPDREVVYIQPEGELDLATLPELHHQVEELLDVGFKQLIVDLRQVTFIDVAGLRLLLSLTGEAHRDGWRLSMIEGEGQVRRLCALADPHRQLRFCSAVAPSG